MAGRIRKLAQLDPARRRYLLRAVAGLAICRIEHALSSTRATLDKLQALPTNSKPDAVCSASFDPWLAAWAIDAAARYVPWRSDCLIRVMAASAWLRGNGHAPHFHLGLARNETGELAAHAWLTLDERILVGGSAANVAAFIPILSSKVAENDVRPAS